MQKWHIWQTAQKHCQKGIYGKINAKRAHGKQCKLETNKTLELKCSIVNIKLKGSRYLKRHTAATGDVVVISMGSNGKMCPVALGNSERMLNRRLLSQESDHVVVEAPELGHMALWSHEAKAETEKREFHQHLRNHKGLAKDIQEIYNSLPNSTNSVPITITVKIWNRILERSNRGIVHHKSNSSCQNDVYHCICCGKKLDGRAFTYWINTTVFPIYKRRDKDDSDAESPGRHHPYARSQKSSRRSSSSWQRDRNRRPLENFNKWLNSRNFFDYRCNFNPIAKQIRGRINLNNAIARVRGCHNITNDSALWTPFDVVAAHHKVTQEAATMDSPTMSTASDCSLIASEAPKAPWESLDFWMGMGNMGGRWMHGSGFNGLFPQPLPIITQNASLMGDGFKPKKILNPIEWINTYHPANASLAQAANNRFAQQRDKWKSWTKQDTVWKSAVKQLDAHVCLPAGNPSFDVVDEPIWVWSVPEAHQRLFRLQLLLSELLPQKRNGTVPYQCSRGTTGVKNGVKVF
ncbi:hypothetical protein BDK51DRAFT_31159 [Blyttiomyces helicus]|uniref:Uncharacterized protein n=1 Tax=Blyttiomyces helicus TaxID=388810 RepID=A0A4P9WNW9_9FUNG|nr:hypothetical protein BDK51DRAFT_31159 [Blyttiomyces helicus]|eukprot:RKO92900.1 hypothetical protein BDK51DRAFT_31159 [Blyttiomyces helicus]